MTAFIAFILFLASTIYAQDATGTRFDLTARLNLNAGTTGQFAQLFIPDYFVAPDDGNMTLVFHLHGATWSAENEVYRAEANAILVNIHLGPFSSPYRSYFAEQSHFQTIIDTVIAVLRDNDIITDPHIARVVVSSFSAGFGGVREILASRIYYSQINALILADGLHSNSDAATMNLQMHDFLRFAKDAAANRKTCLITHSSIRTDGYESTTATASYLIDSLGMVREHSDTIDEIGSQYYRSERGFLRIDGYSGNAASDHMKHLHGIHTLLKSAMKMMDSVSARVTD